MRDIIRLDEKFYIFKCQNVLLILGKRQCLFLKIMKIFVGPLIAYKEKLPGNLRPYLHRRRHLSITKIV
jgi:hypothetical protein